MSMTGEFQLCIRVTYCEQTNPNYDNYGMLCIYAATCKNDTTIKIM